MQARPDPSERRTQTSGFQKSEKRARGLGHVHSLNGSARPRPPKSSLEFPDASPILGGETMQTSRRTWQSFDEMREAAEHGDPVAQGYYGICFQTGQGVQQDYQEAVKWFRRAADQNDAMAQ